MSSYRRRASAAWGALALLLFVGSAHAATPDPQWSRYFYDRTCQTRWPAEFAFLQDKALVVCCSDGKLRALDLTEAARSESFFAAAVRHASAASEYFAEGAWRAEREWVALDRELSAHRAHTENVLVPYFTATPRLPELVDLKDRWIEISGVQYQVRSAASDGPLTGFSEIVITANDGKSIVVDPDVAGNVRILPAFWSKRTYQPPRPYQDDRTFTFRRRGPPATLARAYGPANVWKHELEFDQVAGVWTDRELAQGHLWMAQSSEQFAKWRADHVLSTAVWHYHEGNRLSEEGNANGWTADFPWHQDDWNAKHRLVEAQDHYSEAARLAPGWSEPLVRRAALRGALGQFSQAMQEIEDLLKMPSIEPNLPIEVRSHAEAADDAHVVRARLLTHMPRPWGYPDSDIEATVDASIQGMLRSASRFPDSRALATSLMQDLHLATTEHFTIRQETFFRDDKPGAALLSVITASKYDIPEPPREGGGEALSITERQSVLGRIDQAIGDSAKARQNGLHWKSLVNADEASHNAQGADDALRQKAEKELKDSVADYLGFTLGMGL